METGYYVKCVGLTPIGVAASPMSPTPEAFQLTRPCGARPAL